MYLPDPGPPLGFESTVAPLGCQVRNIVSHRRLIDRVVVSL